FDRDDARQVDEIGKLDYSRGVDRTHSVIGDDQQARRLPHCIEPPRQLADPRVDIGDRGIDLVAVRTETMSGGVDNVEIERDKGGTDRRGSPHPVEYGVHALNVPHILIEAKPVERPGAMDVDLATRSEEHTSEL